MITMTQTTKITVSRFNPKRDKEPHRETYEVPYVEGMSVYNALTHIRDYIDGSLALYESCRSGKCLGCTVTINGKNDLLCTTLLRPDMTVEPLRNRKVIKDLVTEPVP